MSKSIQAVRGLIKAAECTPDAPWFTVDHIWLPGPDVPTYVVAGFSDPHIGKPVVDAFMPDEVEDEEAAVSECDAIMEFCACARNSIPALESLLADASQSAERIRELEGALGEAIDLIEQWYKRTAADDDITWPIYYDYSPEMLRLRKAKEPDVAARAALGEK